MTHVIRSAAVPRHRRGAWAVLLVSAALGLGGCAVTPTPRAEAVPAPVLVDVAQARAEYAARTHELHLPEGRSWPAIPEILMEGAVSPGHMFERGVGQQEAEFQWYCVWADVALAEPARRSLAVTARGAFDETGAWTQMDDNGRALFGGIQDALGRGDLLPLTEYAASNCG